MGRRAVFAESGHRLRVSPEAFVSAFLFPAMAGRSDIQCDLPVDPVWVAGAERARAVAARWWGWPETALRVVSGQAREPAAGRAVFFTGGVDSFHALLQSGNGTPAMVFVEGFDVALDDRERLEAVRRLLGTVAAETGARAIRLRTDLRDHPVFRRLSWLKTHGAALAFAAHLLDGHFGEICVGSTYVSKAHGSHHELDPCWSSSALRVRYVGAGLSRIDKIRMLDDFAIAHLRVCWQNRAGLLNCGVCEKCVRTQLQLHAAGVLGRTRVFPPGELAERVGILLAGGRGAVPSNVIPEWQAIVAELPAGLLREAVERLLRQSRNPRPPGARVRLRRAAGRLGRKVLGRST